MSTNRPRDNSEQKGDMPEQIRDFFLNVIQGRLMRYDVLRFFYQNPYAILTVSDLSVWVSREEKPLADTLQQLASAGYLDQSPASAAFVLARAREKRGRLERFFSYLDDNPELARKVRAQLRRQVEAE